MLFYLHYQIPLSPSLLDSQFAISRKNTPTTDWNSPTAVVRENCNPLIPVLYTYVEITSATFITRLFWNAKGLSKPLPKMLPRLIISKTTMVGLIPGSVMCHIFRNLPAPSTAAASYSSGLIPGNGCQIYDGIPSEALPYADTDIGSNPVRRVIQEGN